jgi:integrase
MPSALWISLGASMVAIELSDFRRRVDRLYSGRRKKTRRRMAQLLGELVELAGPAGTTADLTTDFLAEWLASQPAREPWTRIGYLGYVRAACAWACEEGWLERPPSWRRLRPRARALPPDHLSREEVCRLFSHLRDRGENGGWTDWRLYAAVVAAACGGFRRNELLFLRQCDVDLGGRIIAVIPIDQRDLKTDQSSIRLVPIGPELLEVFRWWLPSAGSSWVFPGVRRSSPWSGGAHGYRPIDHLRSAAAECGIEVEGWQTLRATWATHAESLWGFDEAVIWRILGHSSPLTSRRWYRAADASNLRAIGESIRFGPLPPQPVQPVGCVGRLALDPADRQAR